MNNKVKVRQPLDVAMIVANGLSVELLDIISDELNIKKIVEVESISDIEGSDFWKKSLVLNTGSRGAFEMAINFEITPELKLEGEAREVIRAIQEGRKKAGFNVEDRITLGYSGKEKVFEQFGDMIAKEVLATEVQKGELDGTEYKESAELDGETFLFSLKTK